MTPKFYRLFFSLTGDDRRYFGALASDTEVIAAAVGASAVVWRGRGREIFGDMLSAGTFVEMRKVSASARPMVEPGEWAGWVMGSADNAGSLPVGYAMRGVLLKTLQVGAPIRLLRVKRNGITAIGEFTSSAVVAIRPEHLVETANSIYVVRPADITSAQGEEMA
jgi:hypothetical protein